MSYEVAYENNTAFGPEGVRPVSRTYQYRKVMKPMLERKRRARINRCLDELKELMVSALQAEGENVAKLEKADILELTVRHLRGLRRADRFRAGFTHAAAEVSRCLASTPGVDVALGTRLMTHLGHRLNRLDSEPAYSPPAYSSPPTPAPSEHLPPTPASSPEPCAMDCTAATMITYCPEPLWRPW